MFCWWFYFLLIIKERRNCSPRLTARCRIENLCSLTLCSTLYLCEMVGNVNKLQTSFYQLFTIHKTLIQHVQVCFKFDKWQTSLSLPKIKIKQYGLQKCIYSSVTHLTTGRVNKSFDKTFISRLDIICK